MISFKWNAEKNETLAKESGKLVLSDPGVDFQAIARNTIKKQSLFR